MSSDNSTSARILMKASGETFKVAGLTISTTSTLYVLKYLIVASCALVEYLPHIFNPTSQLSLVSHMQSVNNASWYAVGATCLILTGGVLIRKVGTVLSEEKSIAFIERFLYGASTPTPRKDG